MAGSTYWNQDDAIIAVHPLKWLGERRAAGGAKEDHCLLFFCEAPHNAAELMCGQVGWVDDAADKDSAAESKGQR